MTIGIVGCGNISGIYFENLQRSADTEVVACSDLDPSRAAARAEEHGVANAYSTDELLADPSIDIVLNLTTPPVHARIAEAALQAGRHVYNEKPLTASLEDGRALLKLAAAKGLRIGCAPDTFLGGSLQTARSLLDEGRVGEVVAGTAFMTCRGHEHWHPDPCFYYQEGGGPLFDMGPYYLTALVHLLGPVLSVTACARTSFPTRIISSEPRKGETVNVTTPTHIAGTLAFAQGALVTVIFSFDVYAAKLPHLELYGSEGTLALPDPNGFGGPVRLKRGREESWQDVPLSHGSVDNERGLGVVDMARAIREGGDHRADGTRAYHVLEVMHALLVSANDGRVRAIRSTCDRPELLPSP